MKIGIASDHRGYELKQKVAKYLIEKGYNIIDYGSDSSTVSDYPDYGFLLGEKIVNQNVDYGIAFCGTGIGISIACNKVKGVRCAKVDSEMEAKLAVLHNNANAIALNSTKDYLEVKKIIDIFLQTTFSNEERHLQRINKISDYELEKKE